MAVDDTIRGGKKVAEVLGGLFGKVKGTTSAFDVKGAERAIKKDALNVIIRDRPDTQTVKGATRRFNQDWKTTKKVEKKENKALNPSYLSTLPRWAKALGGLGAGAGVFAGGAKILGGPDAPEYGDWATKLNLPTPGAITTTEQDAMTDWLTKREKAIREAFTYTPTVPGAEMYDSMSAANNQLGAASMAAMNDLASQYGQGAADIKSRGESAGQSINDIYGAGAGALEALGSQASSEYDSMIPVSGEAAVAPEQQRMAGQNLANYLTQNQLIDAQAQGGMAQLAQMLGPAYANQYALMDTQARSAANANKARTEAEYENNRQLQLAQALGELNMSAADAEYERSIKAAQAGSLPTPDPATLNEMAAQWDALPQEDKTYYSAMAVKNGFEGGIQDAYDWVNYQLEQQQQQLGL
jgi:hypothetical protein